MDLLTLSWTFAQQRTALELLGLLWFLVIFDIPRYFLGFVAVFLTRQAAQSDRTYVRWPGTVSVLIAGYNEEASFERCVRSLRGLHGRRVEIVCVDDGSTDGSFVILQRMKLEGSINHALRVTDRGGKSTALNLAAAVSCGEALVVVDCDCTFKPQALERLLSRLNDPRVGAVSGGVLVRSRADRHCRR